MVIGKIFKLCGAGLLGVIGGVSLRLWFPVSEAAWMGGVPVTAPRGPVSALGAVPAGAPAASGLAATPSASSFYRQLAAATPENIRALLDEACLAARKDPEGFASGRIDALWQRCLELAPDEALDWFRRLSIQERFFRHEAFFKAWKAMDPKAGRRAAEVYEEDLLSASQPETITALLEKDPSGALGLAMELPVGPMRANAVERAFLAMLQQDPDEAFGKLMALRESQDVGELAKSMMEQLAKYDPEAAKQSLALFPEGPLRERMVHQLAKEVREQGTTEEALAWIRRLPPGRDQAAALAGMHGERWDKTILGFYSEVATSDPQLAAALFDRMKSGYQGADREGRVRAAAAGIYRTWQKTDPAAALEWAMRQPSGVFGEFSDRMLQLMREQGMDVLTKIGLTADSDAWLDRNAVLNPVRKDNNFEAARMLGSDGGQVYAEGLMRTGEGMEAEAMKTLLADLPQDAFRSGAAASFARRVGAADPAAAAEFSAVAAAGLPAADFADFAKKLSAAAPLATSQWLETMEPGERRDSVIRELTPVILADGDPAAAFQWSLSVKDEAQRFRLAAPALAAWFLADPDAATAAWESPNLSDAARAALQPLLTPPP